MYCNPALNTPSNIYLPTSNLSYFSNQHYILNWGLMTTSGSFNSPCNHANLPTDILSNDLNLRNFIDDDHIYSATDAAISFNQKVYLFNELANNSSFLKDPDLAAFFHQNQNSSISKIHGAENSFMQGSFDQASTMLHTIVPENTTVEDYTLFLNLMLKASWFTRENSPSFYFLNFRLLTN